MAIMWARLRASRGATATLALLAACVTASVGLSIGYSEQALSEALRTAPELMAGPGSSQRATTRSAADPAAQDSAARAAITELFDGVEITVDTSLRSEPHPYQQAADTGLRVILGTEPGLASATTIVDGRWPEAAGEATLSVAAATAAGLGVGDILTVADTELTISGIWQPLAIDAPIWAGDALAVDGSDGSTFGPLLTDAETLRAVDDQTFVRWTIAPVLERLTRSSIGVLDDGLPQLKTVLTSAGVGVRGITVTGGLDQAVGRLAVDDTTVRALRSVPIVLAGLIALLTLAQVSWLIVGLRMRENQILVARGASIAQLSRSVAAEVAVVSGGGVSVGALSVALWWLISGNDQAWTGTVLQPVIVTAVLVVVVVTVCTGGAMVLGARELTRAAPLDYSGRGKVAVGAVAAVLLAVGATFFLWRVWLVRQQTSTDIFVMAAPGVLLLTAVLLMLGLVRPVLTGVTRLAARRPGLDSVLVARQVARRQQVYAIPVILVAAAVASAVLTATYSASTAALADAVDEVRDGAAVRASTGDVAGVSPRTSTTAATARGLDQVSDATLALVVRGRVGQDEVQAIALPPARVPGIVLAESAKDLLAGVQPALPGLVLPEATTQLRVDLVARQGAVAEESDESADLWLPPGDIRTALVGGTVWLADEGGAILRRELGMLEVAGPDSPAEWGPALSGMTSIDLPAGHGAWRVVAVDLTARSTGWPVDPQVALSSLAAIDAAGAVEVLTPDVVWDVTAQSGSGSSEPLSDWPELAQLESDPVFAGVHFRDCAPSGARVRLMPGAAVTAVTGVATQALLDRIGLVPPGATELWIAGLRVPLQVAATVPVIPGTLEDLAVFLDLDALHEFQLRSMRSPSAGTELWVATAPGSADAVGEALVRASDGPVNLLSDANQNRAAAALSTVSWLLTGTALLCALGGTWAVLAAVASTRRGEVVALRSVGVSARRQARLRAREVWLVLALAAPIGFLVGAVVSALLVGMLARTTVLVAPIGLDVPVRVAMTALLIALGGLFVGCALLVRAQAGQVRALAATDGLREEAQ